MNQALLDRIVNAVLYEGYILYPYRASAAKNQRRFNFGVLVPPDYCAREGGTETAEMRTEVLLAGDEQAALEVTVRFLQVRPSPTWQEAAEREVRLVGFSPGSLVAEPRRRQLAFPPVEGAVEVGAVLVRPGLYRIAVRVLNQTGTAGVTAGCRDEILPYSLASAHTILSVQGGEFISLFDPPEPFREAAAQCRNSGAWPVLVGDPGERDAMLASPIILYDYPQVAAESPGDLFDGAEIDEILTLRILTLTDEEKQEMRQSGDRARQILERTETLPVEQLMKLHGAMRRPGDRP